MTKTITPNHDFKPGDILVSSWGYEQTNVDFYQVVGITKCSVKIRPIMGHTIEEGYGCGHTTPVKDAFKINNLIGDGKTARVDKDGWIRISRGISAHKWTGQPVFVSWWY